MFQRLCSIRWFLNVGDQPFESAEAEAGPGPGPVGLGGISTQLRRSAIFYEIAAKSARRDGLNRSLRVFNELAALVCKICTRSSCFRSCSFSRSGAMFPCGSSISASFSALLSLRYPTPLGPSPELGRTVETWTAQVHSVGVKSITEQYEFESLRAHLRRRSRRRPEARRCRRKSASR